MGAFAVRFWNVRFRILASFIVLCKTFWIPASPILWSGPCTIRFRCPHSSIARLIWATWLTL